jgi:hypothetical protein
MPSASVADGWSRKGPGAAKFNTLLGASEGQEWLDLVPVGRTKRIDVGAPEIARGHDVRASPCEDWPVLSLCHDTRCPIPPSPHLIHPFANGNSRHARLMADEGAQHQ